MYIHTSIYKFSFFFPFFPPVQKRRSPEQGQYFSVLFPPYEKKWKAKGKKGDGRQGVGCGELGTDVGGGLGMWGGVSYSIYHFYNPLSPSGVIKLGVNSLTTLSSPFNIQFKDLIEPQKLGNPTLRLLSKKTEKRTKPARNFRTVKQKEKKRVNENEDQREIVFFKSTATAAQLLKQRRSLGKKICLCGYHRGKGAREGFAC